MKVRYMLYPVKVLGPGNRFGIWTSGCRRFCEGCLSPELRKQRPEDEVSVGSILSSMKQVGRPIDGVTISGGEPFDQRGELLQLVERVSNEITRDILIYTGERLEDLLSDVVGRGVCERAATIIDGEYRALLDDGRGLRGSSNQIVHRLMHLDDFDYEGVERRVQSFVSGSDIIVVGLQ